MKHQGHIDETSHRRQIQVNNNLIQKKFFKPSYAWNSQTYHSWSQPKANTHDILEILSFTKNSEHLKREQNEDINSTKNRLVNYNISNWLLYLNYILLMDSNHWYEKGHSWHYRPTDQTSCFVLILTAYHISFSTMS